MLISPLWSVVRPFTWALRLHRVLSFEALTMWSMSELVLAMMLLVFCVSLFLV